MNKEISDNKVIQTRHVSRQFVILRMQEQCSSFRMKMQRLRNQKGRNFNTQIGL